MSDEAPKAPAGWYPDPGGGQRYWDGERWLDIPAPAQGPPIVTELVEDTHSEAEPNRRMAVWITVAVVGVLLLAGGGVGAALKIRGDQAEAERIAVQEAEAEERAQAEEKARADEERQAAADRRERDSREAAVIEIETSVKAMAEGHVQDGIVDGPVLEVSCDPVDGGSTDDLTHSTTVFQCFVANEDNGDGTMSGYYYNATMNWDSGSFTYGLGQP